MNLRRWIWTYLAAGSSFTRWAALVYYGGAGLLILAFVIVLVVGLPAMLR